MIKKEENRAKHLQLERRYIKGVSLIDVDTAIAQYVTDTILPDLKENERTVKVPMIYGNAERWVAARKEGFLRDKRGKIQVPLVMFTRNDISKDTALPFFNENLFIPTWKKYSNKNRYDRFSLMNNVRPTYEMYNVRVPEYVTLTYQFSIWTNFTEHMNKILEAFQWATDRYWGTEDGYRFRTNIDSFGTEQEVSSGTERVIKTEFTMVANAYLLPEHYADIPLVKKEYSPKRVIVGVEVDMSGEKLGRLVSTEWQDVIDYIGLNSSKMAEYVNQTTAVLKQVTLPDIPNELDGSFDTNKKFNVYINGFLVSPVGYNVVFDPELNEITFNFVLPLLYEDIQLYYDNTPVAYHDDDELIIREADEITITGKFEVL